MIWVQTSSKVKRDGSLVGIPSKTIVPGDIVILGAGDGIPADSLILDSKDLFVNEATLTGESLSRAKIAWDFRVKHPIA